MWAVRLVCPTGLSDWSDRQSDVAWVGPTSRSDDRTVYVNAQLDRVAYCIQAWSPSLRKDIDCLENVQRRATKMVAGLKNLSYVQHL